MGYSGKVPKAPDTLSKEAAGMWRKLLAELGEWEESQLLQLRTGLEQWDVMREATRILADEGLQVLDRFGQAKVHPLFAVQRDSASGVRAMHKLLGLDWLEVDE